MPLEAVLIALLVVLGIVGIYLWTRLAASSARIIDPHADKIEELFFGGIMSRHLMTSGPLVRLELHDWGVRLRGTVFGRWIVPTWEARYDELALAELVAMPASRHAVCFRLTGGDDNAVAFLSDASSAILEALERRGVLVNRSITQIRRVRELYK